MRRGGRPRRSENFRIHIGPLLAWGRLARGGGCPPHGSRALGQRLVSPPRQQPAHCGRPRGIRAGLAPRPDWGPSCRCLSRRTAGGRSGPGSMSLLWNGEMEGIITGCASNRVCRQGNHEWGAGGGRWQASVRRCTKAPPLADQGLPQARRNPRAPKSWSQHTGFHRPCLQPSSPVSQP